MSATTNHWKLGLFVVLGVTIGLGALAWLGAEKLDQKVERFLMYFDEPVDGLSIGSEVRYRGMPIGSVVSLAAAPDKMHVEVTSQISVRTLESLEIRDPGQKQVDVGERIKRLTVGVDGRVLRAQIERNPLTGMAVINIDIYPAAAYPMQQLPFDVDMERILPTRPSVIKGILAKIEMFGRRLPEILDTFNTLSDNVNTAIDDLQVKELRGEIQATLAGLRKAMNDLKLERLSTDASLTMTELRGTLDEVTTFTAELRKPDSNLNKLLARYEALGGDVQRMIRETRAGETTAAARKMLAAVTDVSDEGALFLNDLRRELVTMTQTLDAFRRLAELLERDPGALIHGRTIQRLKKHGEK